MDEAIDIRANEYASKFDEPFRGFGYNVYIDVASIEAKAVRQEMTEKACECFCDLVCEKGESDMCWYKHDHEQQIKNTFKYNECNALQVMRRVLEEKT